MKYALSDIDLAEISIVPVGANPHAKVAVWKSAGYKDRYKAMTDTQKAKMRRMMDDGMDEEDAYKACMSETTKGGQVVTPEELTKQLEALEGTVADLTKRAETAEAAVAAITKSADEAGFDVSGDKIVKRADPEYVEIDGERVAKSAIPAPLLKRMESQAAEIAKMKAKADEVELAKRGETELPNLAGTALAKGKLLAAVAGDEAILKSLRAADAAIAKASAELGSAAVDEASASYRLNKMASAYSEANKVPFESAFAEITKSGDGLRLLVESRSEA